MNDKIQNEVRPEKFLELAHGYFEKLRDHDGRLIIEGWMLLADRSFDSFVAYINQRKAGYATAIKRTDLAKHIPFIPHAGQSGFAFDLPISLDEVEGTSSICIVGISQGMEIAKMETWYRREYFSQFPVPPHHLLVRATGSDNKVMYRTTGVRCFTRYWTAICNHVDPHSIKSMLDWGCGCGRLTDLFLKFSGIQRISGCDIDRETIEWCRNNLKPGVFSVIPLYPPTAYADNVFDLIISFSVFTHLSREAQSQWLNEMQRILAPGGLFLTSVHGEFATRMNFPEEEVKQLLKKGIHDAMEDKGLKEVAPEGSAVQNNLRSPIWTDFSF